MYLSFGSLYFYEASLIISFFRMRIARINLKSGAFDMVTPKVRPTFFKGKMEPVEILRLIIPFSFHKRISQVGGEILNRLEDGYSRSKILLVHVVVISCIVYY